MCLDRHIAICCYVFIVKVDIAIGIIQHDITSCTDCRERRLKRKNTVCIGYGDIAFIFFCCQIQVSRIVYTDVAFFIVKVKPFDIVHAAKIDTVLCPYCNIFTVDRMVCGLYHMTFCNQTDSISFDHTIGQCDIFFRLQIYRISACCGYTCRCDGTDRFDTAVAHYFNSIFGRHVSKCDRAVCDTFFCLCVDIDIVGRRIDGLASCQYPQSELFRTDVTARIERKISANIDITEIMFRREDILLRRYDGIACRIDGRNSKIISDLCDIQVAFTARRQFSAGFEDDRTASCADTCFAAFQDDIFTLNMERTVIRSAQCSFAENAHIACLACYTINGQCRVACIACVFCTRFTTCQENIAFGIDGYIARCGNTKRYFAVDDRNVIMRCSIFGYIRIIVSFIPLNITVFGTGKCSQCIYVCTKPFELDDLNSIFIDTDAAIR